MVLFIYLKIILFFFNLILTTFIENYRKMSGTLKVEVYHVKSLKQLATVDLDSGKTVGDVKKAVASQSKPV